MPSKIRLNNAEQTETGRMGYRSEVRKGSPHQPSKSAKKVQSIPTKGRKSSKLQDKVSSLGFVNVKPKGQSCPDLDPEIQHINDGYSGPCKTSASRKKQGDEHKAKEPEEFIKYMSNLPCYLQRTERGDNFQGKALNFGVLDWGLLEKWKHDQDQVSSKRRHPTSRSNTSSSSTLESSTLSFRSYNSSLFQRKQSAVSNHQNLSSTKDYHSQILDQNSSDHDVDFHRSKSLRMHLSVKTPEHYKEDQSLGNDRMEFKLKKGKVKASDLEVISANTFLPLQKRTLSSGPKAHDSVGDKVEAQECIAKIRQEPLLEKNRPFLEPAMLLAVEPSDESGQKAAATTGRDPSYICQSTTGLHSKSRGFTIKKGIVSQQLKPTFSTATSGSVSANVSGCLDNLHGNQGKTSTKARFSPLRRILDPIVKLKALHHLNPAQESPVTWRSSTPKTRLNASTGQSAKKILNFSGWVYANTHGSLLQDEKNPISTRHALLQVLCRNGLPLFTFSFGNDGDILAATMRKAFMPKKDSFDWIYTFHSFQGIKRSGGWLNQGRKDRRHSNLCNLIGQMNVFCSLCPCSTSHLSAENLMVTEFVLSSNEPTHPAPERLEFSTNSELAAIVTEVLIKKSVSFKFDSDDEQQKHRDKSGTCLSNQTRQNKSCCCSVESLDVGLKKESQDLCSVRVILPGGVHSLPVTEGGKPAPLIDRWKSGGSCDCGGWDVACRLTVLNNHGQESDSLSSVQVCSTSVDTLKVDLFVQGAREENRHAFSLAAIKEGLYSVEFGASLSSLQAFSICVACLHSKKPAILSSADNPHKAKTLQESISVTEDTIKTPNRAHVEAIVSGVPYPPLSPVGRV